MSKIITNRQHTVKLERSNVSPQIQPRTAASDAFSELIVMIIRLNGLLLAAGDAMAEPAGQTSARWRILAAIENKPMTVVQIGHAWGLARQSVQRVADILVEEGFAVYMPNPRHRRSQLLALTPEGHSALQRIQVAQRVWANSLGAKIGEADLHQASTILSRVLEVVAKG